MSAATLERTNARLVLPLIIMEAPVKSKRLWNSLVGNGLEGTPMPPRAKINDEWCRKIWMASFAQDISNDAIRAASGYFEVAMIAAAKVVGTDFACVLGHQVIASTATPGRSGRPPGSSTHSLDELNDMIQDILIRDDGSPQGRQSAISAVVANEPKHQRPALKQWLRNHLPVVVS